jgi:DNA modification methylase
VARLVRFFTKPGDVVLDPFLGIGSSLKAAATENRNGIGIELSTEFAQLSRDRLEEEVGDSLLNQTRQEVLQGDSRLVLATLPESSVDFVVTSPPYWNILHKKDHKAKNEREKKGLKTRYSESDVLDLGNIDDYEVFLEQLMEVFRGCQRVLKPKKHIAIVVSDFRDGPKLRMFHADVANRLEQDGWLLKGITILHQAHKRIYPYGYPTSYVPNIHHQYILILQNIKQADSSAD